MATRIITTTTLNPMMILFLLSTSRICAAYGGIVQVSTKTEENHITANIDNECAILQVRKAYGQGLT